MTIDGITCHTEDLCEKGRAAADCLQFVDRRLLQIRKEIQVYQTAQVTYARALAVQIASAHETQAASRVNVAPNVPE